MMMQVIGIIAAAIVFMILGFLWYSPILFGKQWMVLKGYTAQSLKEAQKKMGAKYFLSFLGAILSAIVLQWIMKVTNITNLSGGIGTAFLIWLGFVTTTQLTGWIFSSAKKELYFIDTGYQLVGFVLMGAVLGLVK